MQSVEKKKAIDIMFDRVADCDTETEEQDLCGSEEEGPKDDVADGPTVVERAEDEDEL